ncbi:hypothetical protein ACFVIY_42055 [Streptomyces sp. NPDC127166]|uniref:hypothetical protein n=1 Tax=Streptomyces sp. NPDC127166 TaxID=3345380 RepID=UPI00363A48BB
MRFKTLTQDVPTEVTRDGKTHQVPKPVTKLVPIAPRNWDQVGLRVAAGAVLALTAVAIVWSTISIGDLLKGGPGYAAAALFDVAWVTCIILEILARYDREKRKFVRVLGAVLVVATGGAIFWHGWNADDTALAVVGASVSIVAKILWIAVLKHVDRDLDPEDAAWLEAENSKASLALARAQVQRQVALSEAAVLGEYLAIEFQHRQTAEALGLSRQDFQELRSRVLGVPEAAPLAALQEAGKPTEPTLPTAGTAPTDFSVTRASEGTSRQDAGTTAPQVTAPAVPVLALAKPVPLDLGKAPADLGKPQPAAAATASDRLARPVTRLARTAASAEGKPSGNTPPATIAEAVRRAVADGLTDADAIAAKVMTAMPDAKRYSVRREIHRQRPAIDKARQAQDETAGIGFYA